MSGWAEHNPSHWIVALGVSSQIGCGLSNPIVYELSLCCCGDVEDVRLSGVSDQQHHIVDQKLEVGTARGPVPTDVQLEARCGST